MPELSYIPTFHHDAWLDRVDQVAAGGRNGFNIRYRTIQRDLEQASTVVDQIATALRTTHRPGPGGVSPPTQLTFTPNLRRVAPFRSFTFGPNGSLSGTSPFTSPPGIGVPATGIADIALPEGLTMSTVRFVGTIDASAGSTTNNVTMTLQRSTIGSPSTTDTLATLKGTGVGLVDVVATVPDTLALTDIHRFRYFIKVNLEALANGASTLTVEFVQITFAASS